MNISGKDFERFEKLMLSSSPWKKKFRKLLILRDSRPASTGSASSGNDIFARFV
jgi:hypothetical protein